MRVWDGVKGFISVYKGLLGFTLADKGLFIRVY